MQAEAGRGEAWYGLDFRSQEKLEDRMSTALVPQEVEIIREALVARGESAGGGIVMEIDESYIMPDTERPEVADLAERRRVVQFNAKKGKFKDLETGVMTDTRTGVVLAKLDPGQTWFPEDNEKHLWPEDDFLCRSDSVNLPPYLNPRLSAEQMDRARDRGAGHDCRTCPLAQWKENGDKSEPPECSQQFKILWFDAELRTEVDLQVGGKSIKPLRNYISDLKKPVTVKLSNGRTTKTSLSLYARATVFGPSEHFEEGSREWYEVRPQIGPLVPGPLFVQLREIRETALAALEEARQAVLARSQGQAALPAPVSAAPSVAPPSAPVSTPQPVSTAPAPQPAASPSTGAAAGDRGPAQPQAPSKGRRLSPSGELQPVGGAPAPAPESTWDEGVNWDGIGDGDVPF